MGIKLELVNFTDLFNGTVEIPTIINDIPSNTEDDKLKINRLISTKYENTDLFSNKPSCECGNITDGYNLGVMCFNCNTPVSEVFDKQLKPLVWMRNPKDVAPLINPMVWTMLTKKFTKSGFNIIEWLCNTDYQPSCTRPLEIQELVAMGIKRGYNNFVANFDSILDTLYSLKYFKERKDTSDSLRVLLNMSRNCIFSNYLPLPNKALLIIEDTKVGTYIDPILVGAIDAIRTISSIDAPLANYTIRQKENRTVKTIAMLADFYYTVYHDLLAGKSGLFRKHVFGSRNHYAARAVISSSTKKHMYNEIEIGWSHACTMLKTHLYSKLLRRGFTPNRATGFIQQCCMKYDPLMDAIFKELIDESPRKGLICILVRNPSLSISSVQQMKIVKVKTDVDDPTISLPIMDVAGFNADKRI